MNTINWIMQNLRPTECDSEAFFYDEMESQSGFCLPLIYVPFDIENGMHWSDRGAILDFLISTRGEGKRLLDFGPGDGWPSLLVAPFAGEVLGVDGSRKRVQVCTENAARMGIHNTHFMHVPPGCPLPFPDASFDGVMAASSIEQSPDPRATLREIHRVLRPGGRLRMWYEGLGQYRGGRENEADLEPRGPHSCLLTIYQRSIEQEQARMARLSLDMPVEEALALLSMDGQNVCWERLDIPRLESLRGLVTQARTCTLSHPSGATLVRWMKEIGFREAYPTHEGGWFASQLFRELAPEARPVDLAGVDALLRPLVRIVVEMAAPPLIESGMDAMITAVK